MANQITEDKTYKWYFIAVIVYASWGVFLGVANLIPIVGVIFSIFSVPISFGWFILSIVMLIIFIKDKYDPYYFVLPIYYLVASFFSVGIGFGIGLIFGDGFTAMSSVLCLAIITASFEIIFAAYMIKNKLGVPEVGQKQIEEKKSVQEQKKVEEKNESKDQKEEKKSK